MTRAALVVYHLWIRRLGAEHPVEPYRQLACHRYLHHPLGFVMTVVAILFFEILIMTHCRLCRFDQQRTEKHIALFGDRSQPALAPRAAFARDQAEIASHLLAARKAPHRRWWSQTPVPYSDPHPAASSAAVPVDHAGPPPPLPCPTPTLVSPAWTTGTANPLAVATSILLRKVFSDLTCLPYSTSCASSASPGSMPHAATRS